MQPGVDIAKPSAEFSAGVTGIYFLGMALGGLIVGLWGWWSIPVGVFALITIPAAGKALWARVISDERLFSHVARWMAAALAERAPPGTKPN